MPGTKVCKYINPLETSHLKSSYLSWTNVLPSPAPAGASTVAEVVCLDPGPSRDFPSKWAVVGTYFLCTPLTRAFVNV